MEQAFEMRQFCGLEPSTRTTYPTDRDWDGGLDNEGLDISQLDSYINDANNDNLYFTDLGGVEDLKNLSVNATPRDSPASRQQQQQQHHHHNILPHNNGHLQQHQNFSFGNYNGGGMDRTARYYNRHYNSYRSQHPASNHHHLPDSPPDSGSEPYSPDHPNLSPNQRGHLPDMYCGPHSNSPSILNLGGVFNQIQGAPNPSSQNPHLHSIGPPQPASVHQQQQPTMLQSNPPPGLSGLPYPHPHVQVSMGGPQPPNPSLPGVPPYSQIVGGLVVSPRSTEGPPQNTNKKRKMADVGGQNGVNIKQEPEQNLTVTTALASHLHSSMGNGTPSAVPLSIPGPGGGGGGGSSYPPLEEDDMSMDNPSGESGDPSYQCIRFQPFQPQNWSIICDSTLKELNLVTFRVDADKGFNFSHSDDAFVCQKKNHFQVTTHIQVSGEPYYVKTNEGRLQKVNKFFVHFYGVKTESPSQCIRVEQSQSDRSKKAFHPVPIDPKPDQVTKVTVGRLHFSETTSNNMRKKGKPNPDQRYFFLVVSLRAHCGDQTIPIISHASEKIIVRASNPGQFESDVEYTFQRGTYPESIFHMGKVGINTDRPDEALVIHGNLRITGHLYQPSDMRAKENVQELDTKEQLRNVQSLRVVKYAYKDNFVRHAGLQGDEIYDTGVIAQEVKKVIPDAVRETGDMTLANGEKIEKFLLVNKERIFMENVGAVKELCKVTGNLENRIGELERMSSKITRVKRFDSFKSTTSTSTRASSVASHISCISSQSNQSQGCGRSRRHHQLGRTNDKGFCSHKLLQISTIAVVCVMALCLMALATLYILDYRERREPNQSSSFITTTNGLNYTIITGSRNPTTSFPFNVSSTNQLFSSMSFFPTSFKTYSPSAPSTMSPMTGDTLTSVMFTITTTPRVNPQVRPPVLGSPDDCVMPGNGVPPTCQVYCCSLNGNSSNRRRQQVRPSRPPSITVTRRFRLEGRSTQTTIPVYDNDIITNKLSTIDPYTLNQSSIENQFKSIPNKKSGSSPYLRFVRVMQDGSRFEEESPAIRRSMKQVLSKRSVGSEPSSVQDPTKGTAVSLNNHVKKIEIPELDAIITHIYCLNTSQEYFVECSNGSADNFTYAIPLSAFMNNENLTMVFEFDSASEARHFSVCSNCSECSNELLTQHCEDGTVSTATERNTEGVADGNQFRLTLIDVGKWKRVSYRFRLGLSDVNPRDPCSYESSTLGDKFYEFNFIFYRVCDT